MAAKPIPVERHTTSRMRGTASIRAIASMSAANSFAVTDLPRCPICTLTPLVNRCSFGNQIQLVMLSVRWEAHRVFQSERRPSVVLIVEDEFLIRIDAADMIRTAGFDV